MKRGIFRIPESVVMDQRDDLIEAFWKLKLLPVHCELSLADRVFAYACVGEVLEESPDSDPIPDYTLRFKKQGRGKTYWVEKVEA